MLACQRHHFPLADDDAYLNGASRSPQLRAGAEAIRAALRWREENSGMPIPAFFEPVERLKREFAQLIGAAEPGRIALIPAASYGIATVAKNLPLESGQEIVIAQDQFPSNYYAWERLGGAAGAHLITVKRQANWSQAILEAITPRTAAVAIAHVHWATGDRFDLAAIRRRTDEVGAWLIIDGTQSIGALPFDVAEIRPDALIAGGYKWLLGPYGCGYAYYGPRMDGGIPLEENWINRAESQAFDRLVDYHDEYRPLAARYSVGEHSNFLLIPMMLAGLQMLNEWQPARIQEYTAHLWSEVTDDLHNLGMALPRDPAHHLIGLRLPSHIDSEKLKEAFAHRNITASYRGDALRISPNVYNRPDELHLLLEALQSLNP